MKEKINTYIEHGFVIVDNYEKKEQESQKIIKEKIYLCMKCFRIKLDPIYYINNGIFSCYSCRR